MTTHSALQRAEAAIRSLFIGDSLAMPVHWYYNPGDIYRQFPGGIYKFEDAPVHHPSSIMSLHSTSQGGRSFLSKKAAKQIVGDVILKGKRQYWDKKNQHYHQGMKAGENTLNAHCARALIRCISENLGQYSTETFLAAYIDLLTAEKPMHPDTYAESYHRGFFANLEAGLAPDKCGATTHDTASVGGLVTLGPVLITAYLNELDTAEIVSQCREHLWLTHPDEGLAKIAEDYCKLLLKLLSRQESESAKEIISACAIQSINLNLEELTAKNYSDFEVVGGIFTSACYISGSWPSILYFAYKYGEDIEQALIANTNVGGDNVHRGAVLGTIIGLANGRTSNAWFDQLVDQKQISAEISGLLKRQS
ncbi:MAG: ADP-ribosylglycohydrolase family protein [Pseudohongiellaceae bacterium]